MQPVIELRGAVALLGRFPALAGVDLAVAPGEIVLVQGPNGAGKSTLLRLCAGLLPLRGGEGRVLGADLRRAARDVRRRVGYLGHRTGLYEELSVHDNLQFWARASGADDADAQRAMAAFGLDGRLRDVEVARLSAGQRRRVALAALVARRPELWLLDEPHAALDHDTRDLVDRLVLEAAAAGATVLLATHEHERADAMAQRTVTLVGGVVTSDTAVPATEASRVP